MMNFDQLIGAIEQQMQPAGRAKHLTGTLQRLFALMPADATLADLVVGWQALARPQSQTEEAPIAHRREICGQIGAIATPFATEPGNLTGAVRIWQIWLDACQHTDNPHQTAMAKTFARELAELQSLAG